MPRIDRFWRWLAWLLPRPLVYWCAIRVWAHATTGRWGHLDAPGTTFHEALDRWAIADNSDPIPPPTVPYR